MVSDDFIETGSVMSTYEQKRNYVDGNRDHCVDVKPDNVERVLTSSEKLCASVGISTVAFATTFQSALSASAMDSKVSETGIQTKPTEKIQHSLDNQIFLSIAKPMVSSSMSNSVEKSKGQLTMLRLIK